MQNISIRNLNKNSYDEIQNKKSLNSINVSGVYRQSKAKSIRGLNADTVSFKGLENPNQKSNTPKTPLQKIADVIKKFFVILKSIAESIKKIFSKDKDEKTVSETKAETKEEDKSVTKEETTTETKNETPKVKAEDTSPKKKEQPLLPEPEKRLLLEAPKEEDVPRLPDKKGDIKEISPFKDKKAIPFVLPLPAADKKADKTEPKPTEKHTEKAEEKEVPSFFKPQKQLLLEAPKTQDVPRLPEYSELSRAEQKKKKESELFLDMVKKSAPQKEEKKEVLLLPEHTGETVDEKSEQKAAEEHTEETTEKAEPKAEKKNPFIVPLPLNLAKKDVPQAEEVEQKPETQKSEEIEEETKVPSDTKTEEEVKEEVKAPEDSKTEEVKEETKVPANAKTEEVKASDDTKAEEVKAQETQKSEESKDQQLDMGFYPGSPQLKFFKIVDKKTGTVTIDWYNPNGSIKGVQTKYTDGTDSLMRYYDENGTIPKEEYITFPDGKYRYIKYNTNGRIEKVVDCEEDKKTVVKQDFYNYKSDNKTIDKIVTKFPDGKIETSWYGENGKVEVRRFQEGTKLTKTEWYYEDGKTTRKISLPLENGGQEITKYEKDGRIIDVCITKPDKTTIDEYSKYYYDDKTKALKSIYTTFSNDTELTTWFDENGIASASAQSTKGRKTNTTWYFEDGETPKIMELYLEDGKKQKVIYDKKERWLEFLEYPTVDSTKYSKKTTFSYNGDKEVPQTSTTVYPDGKWEKAWYDEEENITCKQTAQNDVLQKTEWFYEDGVTVKVLRTYKEDGTYKDERFPRKNVSAA